LYLRVASTLLLEQRQAVDFSRKRTKAIRKNEKKRTEDHREAEGKERRRPTKEEKAAYLDQARVCAEGVD